MKVTEETLTPRKASELLDAHWVKEHQRTPSQSTVDAYARAMAAGQWLTTHQGIAIDDKGELIDGVHRCLAIVQSGTPVRMLITRGIPHNGVKGNGGMFAIDAIDRGRLRTVGNQLQIRHGMTNGNLVAASARAVLWLAVHSTGADVGRVTVGDTLRVLDAYGAELRHCVENRSTIPGLRNGFVIGAFAFAMRPFITEIKVAYEQFVTGENISSGQPMYCLRNYLLNGATIGGGSRSQYGARAVLHACQKFITKEEMRVLKQSEQGYTFFLEKQRPTVKKLIASCGYEQR